MVIDRVVLVLDQTNPAGRDRDRSFRNVHRLQGNLTARLALKLPFDAEAVERWDLLRCGLGAVVERLEYDAFDQVGSEVRILHALLNLPRQVGTERFCRWEENPAVLAVDGPAHGGRVVDEVKDPIGLRHAVDVQPVHPEQLNEQGPVERVARDVIQVDPGRRIVVPNVEAEVFFTQPKRLHGVDVLHHDFPEWRLVTVAQAKLGYARLQHFQHECIRGGVAIL